MFINYVHERGLIDVSIIICVLRDGYITTVTKFHFVVLIVAVSRLFCRL